MSSNVRPQSPLFELPLPSWRADQFSLDPTIGGLRKLHVRRLFDILQLCLLRRDTARAHKIWQILVRCREVGFARLWHLGLRVLFLSSPSPEDDDDPQSALKTSLNFLKACQNLDPKQCKAVLMEYISTLIALGRHRDGLDELELYLSSLPYSQDPALHEYAGMLALFLAQPATLSDQADFPPPSNVTEYICTLSGSPYFGRARAYFERACQLDSASLLASGYIALMSFEGTRDLDND